MRHRDAGIRRHRDGTRHPRHDLIRDPGLGQGERLFSAAAEDERIAALEPHDGLTGFCRAHQQSVDCLLGRRVSGGFLSYVDQLCRRHAHLEHLGGDKMVVDHDVSLPKDPLTLDGQQSRITWTCTDQIDAATRFHAT